MLGNALFTAIILLFVAWFFHFFIWRIRIPVAYPYWIVTIFMSTYVAYGAYFLLSHDGPLISGLAWLFIVLIPYSLIGGAYLMVYAGINEYSMSVEILLEIKKYMPKGVSLKEFEVKTLPESKLTGLRLQHLLDGGMISKVNDQYAITLKGEHYANLAYWYRKFLWINFPGGG